MLSLIIFLKNSGKSCKKTELPSQKLVEKFIFMNLHGHAISSPVTFLVFFKVNIVTIWYLFRVMGEENDNRFMIILY